MSINAAFDAQVSPFFQISSRCLASVTNNSHPETSPVDVCSEAVSRRQVTFRRFMMLKTRRDEDEKRHLK